MNDNIYSWMKDAEESKAGPAGIRLRSTISLNEAVQPELPGGFEWPPNVSFAAEGVKLSGKRTVSGQPSGK